MFANRQSRRRGVAILSAALITGTAAGTFAAAPRPLATPEQRAEENQHKAQQMQGMIAHLDHSIDILGMEAPDRQGLRKKVLDQVTEARNQLQREYANVEHRNANKDVRDDKERDKESRKAAPKDYLSGLQTVQQYLEHDRETLSRIPHDGKGHIEPAMKAMERAQRNLQKEINNYLAERRR